MEQKTIKSDIYEQPAMDFELLRAEGVQYLQKLAGDVWTDHNLHDPGITILEQLVFALTDLSYRIDYSIPDLLAEEQGAIFKDIFTPKQILPCNPVTLADWRKFVIDTKGVENAWVVKKDVTVLPKKEDYIPKDSVRYTFYNSKEGEYSYSTIEEKIPNDENALIDLKGIYSVFIQPEDDIIDTPEEEQLKVDLEQKLQKHRNLCEGFEIVILQKQTIQLGAEIVIEDVEDNAKLLAEVYYKIKKSINPQLRFYALEELLDKGMDLESIMEGPLLCHGFLLDDDLEHFPKRKELHMSDIINEIMDVDGVKTVENIHFGDGIPVWSTPINDKAFPLYNPLCSKITIRSNNIIIKVDTEKAIMLYEQKMDEAVTKIPRNCNNDLALKEGDYRDIAEYFSVQNHFPVVYGIGKTGLFPDVPERRKAQSKQLSAYLVLLEQILANYFSQVAHVKDLFSFTSEEDATYFFQSIRSAVPRSEDFLAENYLDDPIASVKNNDDELLRKNRFLNHLLARFGEIFTDYSFLLCQLTNLERKALNKQLEILKSKGFKHLPESIEQLLEQKKIKLQKKLISDKKRYLQKLPVLGANRGKASETTSPTEDWGFKERLEHLFGVQEEDAEELLVVDHFLLRPRHGSVKNSDPYLIVENNSVLSNYEADVYSFQISLVLNKEGRFGRESYRKEVERVAQDEVPAHVRMNIIWCNSRGFADIKQKYDEWDALRGSGISAELEFKAGNRLLILLLDSKFQLPEFTDNLDKNSFELDMKRYLKVNDKLKIGKFSGQLSVEFWFRGVSHEGVLRVGKGQNYLTFAGNSGHFLKSGNQLINLAVTPDSKGLDDNNWHHIAVVFDRFSGECASFFDGKKIDSNPVHSSFKLSNIIGNLYMGTYNSISAYTKGKIAEVKIWDVALTEEMIEENYKVYSEYVTQEEIPTGQEGKTSSLRNVAPEEQLQPYAYWRFTRPYLDGNIYKSVMGQGIHATWIDEIEEVSSRQIDSIYL